MRTSGMQKPRRFGDRARSTKSLLSRAFESRSVGDVKGGVSLWRTCLIHAGLFAGSLTSPMGQTGIITHFLEPAKA